MGCGFDLKRVLIVISNVHSGRIEIEPPFIDGQEIGEVAKFVYRKI